MAERVSDVARNTAALDPNARARFPFAAKLALLGALLTALPVVVVGKLVLDRTTAELERTHRELRILVIREVVSVLEHDFRRAADVMDGVGRVLTDRSVSRDLAIAVARKDVASSEILDHLALYDREGVWIDTLREASAPTEVPPSLDESFRRRAVEHRVATGEVRRLKEENRVLLGVPLEVDGRVSGYVVTQLSLAALQAQVRSMARAHFEGLPGSLLVTDQELRVLAHENRATALARHDVSEDALFAGVGEEALKNDAALSKEFDENEMAYVGTLSAWNGWIIAARVPREVAYATSDSIRRIILAALLGALLVTLAIGVLLARRITKPIRQLSSFARDMAERRFDRRVTVETRDELAFLGDAMSAAAADLEESERRIREEVAIRSDLGRYVPSQVVDRVVRREQDMGLGGRRAEVTVLFADVVAFTPLSEKLSAEQTVRLLNELFTILTEIVFRHEGTLDKFIGDCVMAVWGAPEARADHADGALAAAEDMLRWLEVGNAGWKEKYGVEIQLAIGLHSGEAVVGNVGSESRMQYTAIGEVVNIAARLETIARPGQILLTEATRQAASSDVQFRNIGGKTLAGHAEEVVLFEVSL